MKRPPTEAARLGNFPMGWFSLTWERKAIFLGHQIVAYFNVTDRFKLYIDGRVVDTAKSAAPKGIAYLRGAISEGEQTHIVEVFTGTKEGHFLICVDGKPTEIAN
jgi:hypothetical protein